MLDPNVIEQFRAFEASSGDVNLAHLWPLETPLEVVAWLIAEARASGYDEADAIELVLLDLDVSAPELRGWARQLRRLGYVGVAERLREMARRNART